MDGMTLGLLAASPLIGSFLGLLAKRLPQGRPVVLGRSACDHCAHALGPLDLVPLVSWMAGGGRCRYCGAGLGAFYPAVELAAVAVAASAAASLPAVMVPLGCLLGWTLLLLAAIDRLSFILPDLLTLPLLVAGLAVAAAEGETTLVDHAAGAAIGGLSFWLIAALYRAGRGRDGLGLGDAKLLAAAGAWVSWEGLPGVVLIACLGGLVEASLPALAGRRMRLDSRIAFGPHLCLGWWIVWLFGPLPEVWS